MYHINYTKSCIHALSSWRWAHSCSKHVEDSNKHIIQIVCLVGYLPDSLAIVGFNQLLLLNMGKDAGRTLYLIGGVGFETKNVGGLHPQSPRHFVQQSSVQVSNLTPLLSQSHDRSCYLRRPILALPLFWLQKHGDLCAHDFAHSPYIEQGSLTLPAPEAGSFME